MFLVHKTHFTSHFKLITKKPSPKPKSYELAARSFDEKILTHLKTLNSSSDSSSITLSWMSKAVRFLTSVHFEAEEQMLSIGSIRSESDCFHVLYMDYSQKVLDLCNLISSAVQKLIERRLLLNLSLLLLKSSDLISSPEKLEKTKYALIRSVENTRDVSISDSKAQRAKELLEQLAFAVNKLTVGNGETISASDLMRRTVHALGTLTVFVASVLVTVLYGESDVVEIRVPAEFGWADSVNGVISDLIKPKNENKKSSLLEIEDIERRALAVIDVLDEVHVDGGDERRVRLEEGVKELRETAAKYCDGVDELTNGVNGLFRSVLKTRNGVLDGVRKGDW